MLYTEFNANNNEYKLRLNTRAIVALEEKLGCNPMAIFGTTGTTIPTVTTMVQILHAALQQYQHNITLEKAYTIFDEWIEDGHAATEFLQVIIDVYRVSGIIPAENTEKN